MKLLIPCAIIIVQTKFRVHREAHMNDQVTSVLLKVLASRDDFALR